MVVVSLARFDLSYGIHFWRGEGLSASSAITLSGAKGHAGISMEQS